jgi:hypothetical protein
MFILIAEVRQNRKAFVCVCASICAQSMMISAPVWNDIPFLSDIVLALFHLLEIVYSQKLKTSISCPQVIQLQKACSHPYLFSGIEPEPYVEGEHFVQVSSASSWNQMLTTYLVLRNKDTSEHSRIRYRNSSDTYRISVLFRYLPDKYQTFLKLLNNLKNSDILATPLSFFPVTSIP